MVGGGDVGWGCLGGEWRVESNGEEEPHGFLTSHLEALLLSDYFLDRDILVIKEC